MTPVPQQARYVAIRCVSDINNYLLAIDDIFIGMPDNIPGVTRQEPARVPGAVLGYEVYLDDEKIASTTETSYMLENLPAGKHTAGVTARYASGESAMATVAFDISQSGADLAEADIVAAISARRGVITVAGVADGTMVNVYRPDGVLVAAVRAEGGSATIPVAPGLYLVKAATVTAGLRVR